MPGPDTPIRDFPEGLVKGLDIRKLLRLNTGAENGEALELDRILEYTSTLAEIIVQLTAISEIVNSEEINGIIQNIRENLQRNLRQFLTSELSLQARSTTDTIADRVSSEKLAQQNILTEGEITKDDERRKFEKRVRKVLQKTVEFLKNISNIPPIGIGFTFVEPYTGKENIIQEGPITHDVDYILSRQKEPNKEAYESQHENERHLLLKMSFGDDEDDKEIGYIDFVFDGTEISQETKIICKNIRDVFDTFLHTGLSNVLTERIQEAQEEIWKKFSLLDWRKIIEGYMEILNNIGFDGILICRRFDPETEGACEITKDGSVDLHKGKEEQPSLIKVVNDRALELDKEIIELRITPRNTDTSILMGALLFTSDDERKTQLIAHIAKTLENVIQRREELRESLTHNLTRRVTNLYLDGTLEKLGKHEIVIAIGDMNGFSKWAERLEKDALAGTFRHKLEGKLEDDRICATIMEEFFEEVSIALDTDEEEEEGGKKVKKEKPVLGGFVGDEVLVYFGTPFDTEGHDSEGKTENERDISKQINDALKTSEKIQTIFEKIITKFEKKYGVNLDERPVFSWGIKTVKDYVGRYGSFDRKYTRVQFTAIGTGINKTARTQSAAKNGATLVSYETWLQYLKGGQTDFVQVGPKYSFQGKNLQDPDLVVQVQSSKKIKAQKEAQWNLVQQKILERDKFRIEGGQGRFIFWNETNFSEIPDGDYICPMGPTSNKGAILNLTLHLEDKKEGFPVAIPREKITEIVCLIPDDEEQKMNQQGEMMGVPNDVILRKIGNRFFMIRYENLERSQCRLLNGIIDEGTIKGQLYVSLDRLVPGTYKLRGEKHDIHPDGDVLLKLKRGGRDVDVLVQSYEVNLLRSHSENIPTEDIPISGLVDFSGGFLNFKHET